MRRGEGPIALPGAKPARLAGWLALPGRKRKRIAARLPQLRTPQRRADGSPVRELAPDQRLALSHAARALSAEFDGTFDTETIKQILATSYGQVAEGAKVNQFLPLLAERFARERLKALAKVDSLAAANRREHASAAHSN